eukprot:gnl/MRDRNA2_/MRDRNA2_116389_c0_seq1.p1 gnl/MRDRNA2_/MRDRNA2_116389_c0~~gnl/MRDRNA2_/MRDRNA2_116389_c0_seq1.p1  ORF type:complete len:242 (+),score=29.14 gnl/MRDRNA2_/MRDRNA2_116389_c0_seq1:122-847(+)
MPAHKKPSSRSKVTHTKKKRPAPHSKPKTPKRLEISSMQLVSLQGNSHRLQNIKVVCRALADVCTIPGSPSCRSALISCAPPALFPPRSSRHRYQECVIDMICNVFEVTMASLNDVSKVQVDALKSAIATCRAETKQLRDDAKLLIIDTQEVHDQIQDETRALSMTGEVLEPRAEAFRSVIEDLRPRQEAVNKAHSALLRKWDDMHRIFDEVKHVLEPNRERLNSLREAVKALSALETETE